MNVIEIKKERARHDMHRIDEWIFVNFENLESILDVNFDERNDMIERVFLDTTRDYTTLSKNFHLLQENFCWQNMTTCIMVW